MKLIREYITLDCTAHYSEDICESVREDYGRFDMPIPSYRYVDEQLNIDISYHDEAEFDELVKELLDCRFGGKGYDHTEYDIVSRKVVHKNPFALDGYAQLR